MTKPQGDLLPCPFCGHDKPSFERMGTSGQSCIVVCGNCGCRHESGDEYLQSGSSWNDRAALRSPGAGEGADAAQILAGVEEQLAGAMALMFEERARAESLAADAGRYRWLCENARVVGEHWGGRWSLVIDGPDNGLIAEAIDRAIATQASATGDKP